MNKLLLRSTVLRGEANELHSNDKKKLFRRATGIPAIRYFELLLSMLIYHYPSTSSILNRGADDGIITLNETTANYSQASQILC